VFHVRLVMVEVSILSSSLAFVTDAGPTHQQRDIFAPLAYRVQLHFVAALVVVGSCFRLAVAVG